MNWWFTPISFILTLFIYVTPPILLRFAVFRKPIEHKKARNFCIIYGIICLIILAIISKEVAILQCLSFLPLGFVNYFILAGIKENPSGQILLYHLILYFCIVAAERILCIIFRRTLYNERTISSLIWFSRIVLIIFGMFKWEQIKSNVLEKFRQKELYRNKTDGDSETI